MARVLHGCCVTPRVGQTITVRVETLFDGGMVVCYRDKAGTELRGALLKPAATDNPLMFLSGEKDLANPVSLLHDHPCADLRTFARSLAMDVPASVLDHWNSPAKLPGSNPHAGVNRRQNPIVDANRPHPLDTDMYSKWRSGEYCCPPVVELAVNHATNTLHTSERQAKVAASRKIERTIANMNIKTERRLSLPFTGARQKNGRMCRAGSVKSESSRHTSPEILHMTDKTPSKRHTSSPRAGNMREMRINRHTSPEILHMTDKTPSKRHTRSSTSPRAVNMREMRINLPRLPYNGLQKICLKSPTH